MRLNNVIPLLAVLTAVVSLDACAQVDLPGKLSLKDAVSVAIDRNYNLKASQASKLDSLSTLRQQRILTTYGMGVSTAIDRNTGVETVSSQFSGNLQFNGLAGTTSTLSFYPFGMGAQRSGMVLSLIHPLLKGTGRMSTKYDAIQSALVSTGIQGKQVYQTEQQTVLNVISTYYQAVLAAQQVQIQEQAVKLAEESAEYVRRRVEEGLERGILVTQQQVYVAQTKDSLNLAQQSARGATDNLMIAMGVGVGQSPTLTDPVPECSTEMPDLSQAIQTALKNRSELAIYDQQMTDTQRKLAIKNDSLKPDLNVVASFNSSNSNPGLINTNLINSGAMTVGLMYNFPLDKRIAIEERDTTARSFDTLKRQRAYSTEQISNEVRSAYRSLDSARISLGIYTQSLDTAKENLRIAQRMVEEGEGDSLSVVEAQKSLVDNQSSIASAKTNLFLARKQLEYAIGEDLTSMVVK